MYTSCRRSLASDGFIIDSGGEGESSVVSVAHIMLSNTEFLCLRHLSLLTSACGYSRMHNRKFRLFFGLLLNVERVFCIPKEQMMKIIPNYVNIRFLDITKL